jgi:hypothetical protein
VVVAQSDRQGVAGMAGYLSLNTQDCPDHRLDLALFGGAVSGDRRFYLSGGILEYRDVSARCRQKDDTPRMGKLEGAGYILGIKEPFHGNGLGGQFGKDSLDPRKNNIQTAGERKIDPRANLTL